jgi:hypothetical protein
VSRRLSRGRWHRSCRTPQTRRPAHLSAPLTRLPTQPAWRPVPLLSRRRSALAPRSRRARSSDPVGLPQHSRARATSAPTQRPPWP